MIKAIIFDCFGVLTTDTWRAFIDAMPPEADKEAARDAHRAYSSGLISKEECAKLIKEATGRSFTEAEDIFSTEVAKNTALLDYITELKKSYKIGMISNVATPWITDSFLTPEEQALFDEMIFSYDVGFTKPDRRIFLLVCERLRIATQEAVMIDDIDSYCEAARREGLYAIEYKENDQLKRALQQILSQE